MCQKPPPPPNRGPVRDRLGPLSADVRGQALDNMGRKSRERSRGLGRDALGGGAGQYAPLPGVLGALGFHRGMTPFRLDEHPDTCRWKRFVLAARRTAPVLAAGLAFAACSLPEDPPPHVREGVIVGADVEAGTVTLRDEEGNETRHDGTHSDLADTPASDWAAFVGQAAEAYEVNTFQADDVFDEGEPSVPWSAEITTEELGVEINYDVADDEAEAGGD